MAGRLSRHEEIYMETKNETEKITARFLGRVKDKKRWIYQFENETDPDHPLKFSLFDPGVPDLKEGVEYTFEAVHVPLSDGSGKFYHNIVREGRDGPYKIQQAEPDKKVQISDNNARENYWRNREKRDIEESKKIAVQWALNSGIELYVQRFTDGNDTEDQVLEKIERYARKLSAIRDKITAEAQQG